MNDERSNFFVKKLLICFCLIGFVGGIYFIGNDIYDDNKKTVNYLVNLHCQGATNLLKFHGIDEKNLCHCMISDEAILKESIIYPIGGSGINRQNYFVKIANKFYLIEYFRVSSEKKKPKVVLLKLKIVSQKISDSNKKLYLLIKDKSSLVFVYDAIDFVSLYKSAFSSDKSVTELEQIYKNVFCPQLNDILLLHKKDK